MTSGIWWLVNLANVYLQIGQVDRAILHYEATLKVNPAYASAHFNLGTILLQKKNAAAAAEHFQKVVELEPNNIDIEATSCRKLSREYIAPKSKSRIVGGEI